MSFKSCNSFWTSERLFFASKKSVMETIDEIHWELSFYALQVSVQQIFCAFAEKPNKFLCTGLKELTIALARRQSAQSDREKILCVHRPKTLNA